jgi:hypothetical protein
LVQGGRWVWGQNNSDVRYLQSVDKSSRVAATYWDWNEVQVRLSFSSAYSGNLELYALDPDPAGRRETITVDNQTVDLNSDFSQGAWAIFPINVAAGGSVTIKVDRTAGPNAVLSGIFLGGGAPTCDRVIWPGQSVVGLVNSLGPGQTGCLHGGTYSGDVTTGVSGSAGAPITITSYPGERATVVGIVYVPVGSDYLTFSHLNLVGTSEQSVSVQLYGNNATLLHDDITNNHQSGSCVEIGDYDSSYAAMVSNSTIEANRIHDCGMASDGPHDHGIYVAASTNAVISDNLIWGTQGGWGIQLWTSSQGSLIAHNVIDQNYAGSVLIAGANVSPAFQPSSNNTIQYNLITNPTSGYNIASYWQNGAMGSGNTVSSNCLYGAPSGDFDTSDGGFTQTNNLHANPQYTDPTNHNYRLQSTTPCLPLVGYDTATTQNPG